MSDPVMDAFNAFADAVEAQLAAMREEIVEQRAALVRTAPQVEVREGPAGRDGVDGKDGESGKDGENGKDGGEGPAGRDGTPGKDADPAEVERMVTELVTRAVAAIPTPKDGKDADVSALPEMVAAAVARATEALPAMVNEVATRVISTLPRPQDGADGQDGIATREELDSLIEVRFADLQSRNLADLHRGVWRSGEMYQRGQIVVLDGSTWLAMSDGKAKPETDSQWRLLAKQGRNGRDKT